jgi:hypothetical protein
VGLRFRVAAIDLILAPSARRVNADGSTKWHYRRDSGRVPRRRNAFRRGTSWLYWPVLPCTMPLRSKAVCEEFPLAAERFPPFSR